MPEKKEKNTNSLVLIAAAAEDNALGKDNDLLWHLPDDFKRFKKLTTSHSILMGRKTFESFKQPLPNRRHIIVTRSKTYTVDYEQCEVVHSVKEALKSVQNEKTAYCIGGGQLYKQCLPFADIIELTRVHAHFDGADTFFPEFDPNEWKLVFEEHHPSDERHKYSFTYLTYVRR